MAYTRLHSIAANSTGMGNLKLTLGNLARTNEKGDMVLYPGNYRLAIDVDGAVGWNFTLVGKEAVLNSWPAAPAFGNPGNATVR